GLVQAERDRRIPSEPEEDEVAARPLLGGVVVQISVASAGAVVHALHRGLHGVTTAGCFRCGSTSAAGPQSRNGSSEQRRRPIETSALDSRVLLKSELRSGPVTGQELLQFVRHGR